MTGPARHGTLSRQSLEVVILALDFICEPETYPVFAAWYQAQATARPELRGRMLSRAELVELIVREAES